MITPGRCHVHPQVPANRFGLHECRVFLTTQERLKKNYSRSAAGDFGVLARLSEGACPQRPVTACPAVAFGEGGSENEAKTQKIRCLSLPNRAATVFLKML
jgi:hypothetical protein